MVARPAFCGGCKVELECQGGCKAAAVRQVRYQGYLAYPLFGFPDVTNFAKYMPLKTWVFWATFKLDEFLGRLPLIRRMAFAVRIRAQKPASAR